MGLVYFAHLLMAEILWSAIHFRKENRSGIEEPDLTKNKVGFFCNFFETLTYRNEFFDILGILKCTGTDGRVV